MGKVRSILYSILVFIVAAVVTFSILTIVVPKNSTENNLGNQQIRRQEINLVALGDSLTEGIGDASQRGGYVPLASAMLEDKNLFSSVETVNAGKSGAVASEIMKMIQIDTELEEAISAADIVVLSAGGNNLVHTFQRTGFNAPKEAFDKPLEEYQQELTSLFEEIRKWNAEAPLYVFGIYNPYSYYFSEIEPLQQIVDMWNMTTKQVVEESTHSYFIPIDHLFNSSENVVSGEEVEESTEETAEKTHPYLFQGDYFHPNEEGYHLMADALVQSIEESWPGEQNETEE